jgi:hypothetical protein
MFQKLYNNSIVASELDSWTIVVYKNTKNKVVWTIICNCNNGPHMFLSNYSIFHVSNEIISYNTLEPLIHIFPCEYGNEFEHNIVVPRHLPHYLYCL